MMFRKLRLINKNQKGFTALELLVSFAVTGIISGGITATTFQVINGSARSNNHMMAVRQAQNAGYWVSHDAKPVQEAPVIVKNDGQLESITLVWTDWNGTQNTVTYTLEGTELFRALNGQQIRVAQFINPAPTMTNCDFADTNGDGVNDTLIFKVTATVGSGSQGQSETREYRIVSRAM